jgi:hypothetical protein
MNYPPSITTSLRGVKTLCQRFGVLKALLCLSLLLAANVHAEDEFSLDFVTIGSGGGTEAGGEFSLDASVGQWEAGASSNDEFSTEGGFWSIVAALQPPTLTIVSAGPSQVTISWTPNPDFILQETSSLSQPNWTNSPSGETNSVTLIITENLKFYRLFKP